MDNVKKIQAAVELVLFFGQEWVEITKGPQYGFGLPTRITAERAKKAIDAINNLAKISPFNDAQIELLNIIVEVGKLVVDYTENQERR